MPCLQSSNVIRCWIDAVVAVYCWHSGAKPRTMFWPVTPSICNCWFLFTIRSSAICARDMVFAALDYALWKEVPGMVRPHTVCCMRCSHVPSSGQSLAFGRAWLLPLRPCQVGNLEPSMEMGLVIMRTACPACGSTHGRAQTLKVCW